MCPTRIHTEFERGKLKEKNNVEDLSKYGRDNIKIDLKEKNGRLWTAYMDLMIGTSVRLS